MAKKKTIQARSLFDTEPVASGEPTTSPDEPVVLPDPLQKIQDKLPEQKKPYAPAQMPGDAVPQPRRTGTDLKPGDEVNVLPGILKPPLAQHEKETFVVVSVNPFPLCESGFNIIAQVKGNPEFRTAGTDGRGIDANWFKKIENP